MFKSLLFFINLVFLQAGEVNVEYKINGNMCEFYFNFNSPIYIDQVQFLSTLNTACKDKHKWTNLKVSPENFTLLTNRNISEKYKPETIIVKIPIVNAKEGHMHCFCLYSGNQQTFTNAAYLGRDKKGLVWASNETQITELKKNSNSQNGLKGESDSENSSNKILWIVMGSILGAIAVVLILILIVKMCTAI